MKIWNSYGSEHSANMVMIGTFKDARSAEEAKEAIDQLTEYMTSVNDETSQSDHYSDEIMNLLQKLKFHSVSPSELEQFTMDIHCEVKDQKIVFTTDESDISAFLKLMVDKGARVEAYSAHDYPESTSEDVRTGE